MPFTTVADVHLVHSPGQPPNIHEAAVTVIGLSPNYGGAGGRDLVFGRYDALSDTFVPNALASGLNTNLDEDYLTLHNNALFAVFNRWGMLWLAARQSSQSAWQVVGQITVPGQIAGRASLADRNGATFLLYTLATSIVMQRIGLASAVLTGPPIPIVAGMTGNSFANDPVPVVDPTGELVGLSHCDRIGPQSDRFLSLDLDPSTPPLPFRDVSAIAHAGGMVGGRFFDGEWSAVTGYNVFVVDAFWCAGGRCAVGGTMQVRMLAPPTGSATYLSFLAASTSFLASPQAIPGVVGEVGLTMSTGWISAPFTHDNRNGEAVASWTVPNVSTLSGATLAVQCITFDLLSANYRLGNTASLVVE